MAICIICEEQELKPRSQLPTCYLCRGSMGRWARRRPAEILERRRKLHIYDLRMEYTMEREEVSTKVEKYNDRLKQRGKR